jgi:biotin carboxyl carrier protein
MVERGGEVLHVHERLVLSPVTGRFVADDGALPATEGDIVLAGASVGDVVGSGETTPVTTPFTGVLVGLLALHGERVREGQPIAWMRVA